MRVGQVEERGSHVECVALSVTSLDRNHICSRLLLVNSLVIVQLASNGRGQLLLFGS
jgi:hypothetical protein